MPRYIDAGALLEDIEQTVRFSCRDGVPSAEMRGANKIIDRIKAAPTISPDEVRGVGTWLRKEKVRHNLDGDGDYRYECSACGHSDEHNENVHVPFCWYCGAKMEVEGDA